MINNQFYQATYILNDVERTEEFYVASPHTVRQELASRGVVPTQIKVMSSPWWKEEIISMAYKKRFLRAIGFHVRAGMSPGAALRVVTEGEENHSIRKKLELAQQVMIRGGMFSNAIETLDFYPYAVIALLAAGEKTGTLPESIEMSNNYLTETKANNKGYVSSAIWFGLEFLMAFSGVVAVQYQFLPWIKEQVISSNGGAEGAETLLAKVDLASMVNGSMLILAIVFMVSLIALFATLIYAKGEYKLKAAHLVAKLPGMKPVIYDSEFYVSFSLIAKMLSKGVAFSEAIKTCQETSKMPDIGKLWVEINERLKSGYTIAHSMNFRSFFSKAELVELQAHQDAKQLQQVFETMSEDRHEMALQGKKRVVMMGFAISIGYSFLSALIAIWALMLQNQGIDLGIN